VASGGNKRPQILYIKLANLKNYFKSHYRLIHIALYSNKAVLIAYGLRYWTAVN